MRILFGGNNWRIWIKEYLIQAKDKEILLAKVKKFK
jgi:hypothetical protein